MSYPNPRQSQDSQEPLLQQWRTMAADSTPAPISAGDIPVTGKEVHLTGSASSSDVEVHRSGKGYREGATFATRGLRQENYRPVDSYEGLHRYDPDFEWEPEEERKVIRKVTKLLEVLRAISLTSLRSIREYALGSA